VVVVSRPDPDRPAPRRPRRVGCLSALRLLSASTPPPPPAPSSRAADAAAPDCNFGRPDFLVAMTYLRG
jgi:hypothetical protein